MGVFYAKRWLYISGGPTERMEAMKHLKSVSKAPRRAQDVSVGSVLTVLGQLLTVFAGFFTTKQAASAA